MTVKKRPRYRHKKRGTTYELLGIGKMQSAHWLTKVAIYRSLDDGSLWVRPREEFEDGRFELIKEHEL